MKRLFIVLLLLQPLFSLARNRAYGDTVIRGVPVQFSYRLSIFPDDWLTGEIDATGGPIDAAEIPSSITAIIKALNKYPAALLKNELRAVYFLKWMKMYDVGFGGTNSLDAVYISNNGAAWGYTDLYLEQTFHHEFSSILLRNYAQNLDTNAWKAANIPGFDYNDPYAGVGAIRNNESSQDIDTALCRKGFLTQYALSGLENDLNTLAQNLFRPEEEFWAMVKRYPRLKEKIKLLIKFYHSLDPVFTKKYFMEFDR